MMPTMGRGLPRAVDVAVAGLVLAAALPLLLLAAIAILLTSPGPVFFRHRRVGKDGQPFDMLKFRTMRPGAAGPEVTARADPRITGIGGLLRKTKIDELPELWNVIRGDMALVGPRPEAARYVDTTSLLWREVLRVRPGVTDPVTLRLRNEEELLAAAAPDHEWFYRVHLLPYKLQGNLEYSRDRSWRSDLAVLSLTVFAIVAPSRSPRPSPHDIVAAAVPHGDARPPAALW